MSVRTETCRYRYVSQRITHIKFTQDKSYVLRATDYVQKIFLQFREDVVMRSLWIFM